MANDVEAEFLIAIAIETMIETAWQSQREL
jgi:hypothetical protein